MNLNAAAAAFVAVAMPNTSQTMAEGAEFVAKAEMIGVSRTQLNEFMATQTSIWDFKEAWERLVLHVNGAA